jgi:hypothetical protein
VLIPRLFTQWRDAQTGINVFAELLIVIIIEAFLLVPLLSLSSLILFTAILIAYHTLQFILHKRPINVMLKRIVEFLFIFFVGGFIFGIFDQLIQFNDFAINVIKIIFENNALLSIYNIKDVKMALLFLFAIIVLVNEANHLIRYILGLISTEPKYKIQDAASNADRKEIEQELYRGKIIGVIERILFFFFVITGNYASIAFILAAKGFTRYKEMDDKNFAEYVLIGTLLSITLSILWSYYIKGMIEIIN